MEKGFGKEILVIIIAAIILGLSVSFLDVSLLLISTISFIIIIGANVAVKKIYAYSLEADTKTKFWEWYQYGFPRAAHFKKPLPMMWLPLVLSLISKGFFWWLAILEFDVKPRVERVSRRHGLYRFSEITDWHVALIASVGIVINLILAIIGYIVASWLPAAEQFATLSIYFAAWSIIPLGSLDGSKIFFGSRALWFTLLVIVGIFLGYSFMVV